MPEEKNPMEKFSFLLGKWRLIYDIPESSFSPAIKGEGEGDIKRFLDDKYVTFDYRASLGSMNAGAHGIFARDAKADIYRYWWFENSGSFMEATCEFKDDNTLFMNWHNSVLVQSFSKKENGNIELLMRYPKNETEHETILKVTLVK